MSLINAECQRFCAMAGLDRFTMPRDVSLCSWALQASEPEVLVIENMEADARRATAECIRVSLQCSTSTTVQANGCWKVSLSVKP